MDQEIRVAADGAGKVGIEVRTQSIVALVVLRVPGLLHGAQEHHAEDIRIGFILDPLHQILQGLLADGIGGPINGQTKTASIIDELLQFLSLGLLMNPVDEGQLQLGKVLGHTFIGRQHEGLNHPLGNTPMAQDNINRQAFLIDQDFSLAGIKIEGAAANPHGFQSMMELGHQLNAGHNCLIGCHLFCIASQHVIDI